MKLFSGSKTPTPKLQPFPAPPVVPQNGGASDNAMKQAKARRGYESTLLTGDLVPADTGKRKLLGS